MRTIAVGAASLLLLASALSAAPSQGAATTAWSISSYSSAPVALARNGGTAEVSIKCPNGYRAISGHVVASEPDDVRRTYESLPVVNGGTYAVHLVDFTEAAGSISVTATVRCVPDSYFADGVTTASAQFIPDGNHLAEGTVPCSAGRVALGALVSLSGGDTTLLTSAPTGQTGWEARAYLGSTSGRLNVTAYCVLASDVLGLKTVTHLDSVGWGASASATCASGLVPVTGGTVHVGGDSGAITIHQRPTANGWTSTTLSLSTGLMQTTVLCIPAANPTVQVSGDSGYTSSTSATWTFSGSDPASAGGYTLGFKCRIDPPSGFGPLHSCTSPVSVDNLTNGINKLEVYAETSDGRRSLTSYIWVTVDTYAPSVYFSPLPDKVYATASPMIGYYVSDQNAVIDLDCWVDDGVPVDCDTGFDRSGSQTEPLSGLSEGEHVLHVRPEDQAGNSQTYDYPFAVDTNAPKVSMTKPASAFTLALSTTAAWTGSDVGQGLAGYAVRSRRAPTVGGFGAWTAPVTLGPATTSKGYSGLLPGSTYCYGVRSNDKAGNSSPESSRCTAVPLDERSMTRSRGWTASSASGWFKGTALSTRTRGATLSKGATLRRIALVAQKCATCGTVGVYVGQTRIATVSLAGPAGRRTIVLPAFSLRTGTVVLKVLSTNKLVKIDAVGLSAS